MDKDVEVRLASIDQKISEILTLLQSLQPRTRVRAPASKKMRLSSISPAQLAEFRTEFDMLFDHWSTGADYEVLAKLESMDAERLRMLADANNLNVTSKMSKEKVLNLIGMRFREKKQLRIS